MVLERERGRLSMKRDEIAKKMADAVIDIEKELAAKTHKDIRSYLEAMRREFNLKAIYEDLSVSGFEVSIKFKGRKLEFTLIEKEIVVNLITDDGNQEEFDVIKSVDGKLICNDGDFELSELDGFLNRAFGDLLE